MPYAREKGSYLLGLSLQRNVNLKVGRLGCFLFPPGHYLYAGSARGPGGLYARLARHRRREKRPHWHIDYLLAHARLTEIWTVVSKQRLECIWAEAMRDMEGTRIVAPRFGASDCRCAAHLVYFTHHPGAVQITAALQARTGEKIRWHTI